MRWFIAPTLLTLAAAAAACGPGAGIITDGWLPSDTVQIRVGEQGETGELVIGFVDVPEDSRCAVDVVCVWEGNAQVALATVVGGVERALALNTSDGAPVGARSAEVDGYRITVLWLEPVPSLDADIPVEDYRVALEIAVR